MARLIDADALIEKLVKIEQAGSALKWGIELEPLIAIRTVGKMVQAMPTVDAALVKHGRWVTSCSLCGVSTWPDIETKYCPNCGAQMDGGEDDADGETPLSR